MRACLLATELARRAGLDGPRPVDVTSATLLRSAGCAAASAEVAAMLGGGDVVVRARGDLADTTRPAEVLRLLAGLAHGLGGLRILARAPLVPRFYAEAMRADCEVGAD